MLIIIVLHVCGYLGIISPALALLGCSLKACNQLNRLYTDSIFYKVFVGYLHGYAYLELLAKLPAVGCDGLVNRALLSLAVGAALVAGEIAPLSRSYL